MKTDNSGKSNLLISKRRIATLKHLKMTYIVPINTNMSLSILLPLIIWSPKLNLKRWLKASDVNIMLMSLLKKE
jgi:hypothetical protein